MAYFGYIVYGAILLLASTDFNTLIIYWNGELLQKNIQL